MQSDDATEPLQWDLRELRRSLEEWAAISLQMIDLLHATADADRSRNWRPHLSQITAAVEAFGTRCRQEAQDVSEWRVDGLDPDEAFERVREQGHRLVAWLQRIMAE
jgi:hypothetical protein